MADSVFNGSAGEQRFAAALSIGVFLLSLPLLIYHAAPGISFHDSGEFALAAASYGITHPPGAPTWTLLAAPFAHVLGFTNFARAANCFSAAMGAASLALLFALAYRLLREITDGGMPRLVHLIAALCAPAFLLNSSAFLEQSFVAEQYTLMTALMLLFLLLLVNSLSAWTQRKSWVTLIAGLVAGFAMGNHPSQVVLIAGLFLGTLAIWKRRGFRMCARYAAWSGGGLFIGLLVYLFLPIRAAQMPLLDAVSATSWTRFVAALTRKVYEPRPFAMIPSHFVAELLRSYRFLNELSILGCLLALIGLAALLMRRTVELILPTFVIGGYGIGMFWGFLRQNFDEFYVILYGIQDWHLPLYAGGALLASIGLGLLVQWIRASTAIATSVIVLLVSVVTCALQFRDTSLRNFTAPQRFIADMWRALPEESLVITNTDNATMMLSYYSCRIGKQVETQRVIHGELSDLDRYITSRGDGEWTTSSRVKSVSALANADSQPLNLPRLGNDHILASRIFADHHSGAGAISAFLLPAGFLYELSDDRITTGQIVAAETKWRKMAPDMYDPPAAGARVHRLEREARGTAFWNRAGYFYSHELWDLAKADYERALQWTPNNGHCWYGIGLCGERMGGDKATAVTAYERALQHQSWLAGPQKRLQALRH